ncbi:hypothetical protein NMY22_g18124 [Coprinellus aureogranulatus]|nr:hypothetical protein NMY22_g18124 [Coprinellus aureogranulatus]
MRPASSSTCIGSSPAGHESIGLRIELPVLSTTSAWAVSTSAFFPPFPRILDFARTLEPAAGFDFGSTSATVSVQPLRFPPFLFILLALPWWCDLRLACNIRRLASAWNTLAGAGSSCRFKRRTVGVICFALRSLFGGATTPSLNVTPSSPSSSSSTPSTASKAYTDTSTDPPFFQLPPPRRFSRPPSSSSSSSSSSSQSNLNPSGTTHGSRFSAYYNREGGDWDGDRQHRSFGSAMNGSNGRSRSKSPSGSGSHSNSSFGRSHPAFQAIYPAGTTLSPSSSRAGSRHPSPVRPSAPSAPTPAKEGGGGKKKKNVMVINGIEIDLDGDDDDDEPALPPPPPAAAPKKKKKNVMVINGIEIDLDDDDDDEEPTPTPSKIVSPQPTKPTSSPIAQPRPLSPVVSRSSSSSLHPLLPPGLSASSPKLGSRWQARQRTAYDASTIDESESGTKLEGPPGGRGGKSVCGSPCACYVQETRSRRSFSTYSPREPSEGVYGCEVVWAGESNGERTFESHVQD